MRGSVSELATSSLFSHGSAHITSHTSDPHAHGVFALYSQLLLKKEGEDLIDYPHKASISVLQLVLETLCSEHFPQSDARTSKTNVQGRSSFRYRNFGCSCKKQAHYFIVIL